MSNATAADVTSHLTDFLLQEGIYSADHLEVTEKGTPDMSVDVAAGLAFVFNDSWTEFSSSQKFWEVLNDATVNKAISSNSSGSTRIDRICVKVDDAISPGNNGELAGSIVVVEGTPGAGAPAIPNDHLPLARVTVANGASSITNANITDDRVLTGIDMTKIIIPNSQDILGVLNSGALATIMYLSNTDALDFAVQLILEQGMDIAGGENILYDGANPYRTIWAGSFLPTVTNGCDGPATEEIGATTKRNFNVLAFGESADEHAYLNFAWPDSWDAGTIKFRFFGFSKSGVGGAAETVNMALTGRCLAHDEAIDQTNGTPQAASLTWTADEDILISSWSNAITLAGTPAAGELVNLDLYRDVSEDTLTGDFQLIGIQIEYQQTTFSD